MNANTHQKLVLALPKGRILKELRPLLSKIDIIPEDDFDDPLCRKLVFGTNHDEIEIVRVRSFDVATFVNYGAAQMGVVGGDVLAEFSDYTELYSPIDLQLGACRLSMARLAGSDENPLFTRIRIATKYPNITQKHFAKRGVQVDMIKLNGAMELAPNMGMCDTIVDLVSSGATLQANGLVETEVLMQVTSRLIVNRTANKTRSARLAQWIERIRSVVDGK